MADKPNPPERPTLRSASQRASGTTPSTGDNRFSRPQSTKAADPYDQDATQVLPKTGATTTTQAVGGKGGASGTGGTGGKGGAKGGGKKKRPKWQRWLRAAALWGTVAILVMVTVVSIGMAIVYARLEIPEPNDFAQAQSSTIYYSDGTTVMGRLGVANREDVAIEDLDEWVPHAFVSAEDRSFYTNPGVDFLGMARGMFNTIVLGKKQGGSTITQQYVERYYVGETTTDLMGKAKEALLALKIDQQQDKDEILENYMNTVYFGRGAYGVQAASREYYGKDATELTVSEAALLAGILPAPSAWDPRFDLGQATYRWNYVLDGMVAGGWLDAAERLKLDFPETIEYANEDVFAGSEGYILREAINEVADRAGISVEDVETRGYRIVTTIDPPTQLAAENAVKGMAEGAAPNLRVAIVTIDPATGAITSMYGGADYLTIQRNAVTQDIAQAGSTFKPFALIAALEGGMALETEYVGDSPMALPGFSNPVRNFANVSYGQINLIDATANSVNTVFVQLAHDVGNEAVREVAVRAGLPETTSGLEANAANVLGTASPHPLDMASAYATIAAGGVYSEPFLVQAVYRPDGTTRYEHHLEQKRVFSTPVIAEVTYAMQQVVTRGSGVFASNLNRPIAGKTGSSTDNKSAWFIGFTPQIVGAVALYQVGPEGQAETITPFGGFKEITGATVPVRIWTAMMGEVLRTYPVVSFPDRSHIGVTATPSPTVGPSPSASPSTAPSAIPTPTPSLTLPPVLPSPSSSSGGGGLLDPVLP